MVMWGDFTGETRVSMATLSMNGEGSHSTLATAAAFGQIMLKFRISIGAEEEITKIPTYPN